MPCPICKLPKDGEADHRFCVLELLKAGNIKNLADWCRLCEVPETKIIGKIKVKIPKQK
jgi:hypothetical protein